DLARRPRRRPLEQQVLEEVGRARFLLVLVARADADPEAEGHRAHVVHALGDDGQPAVEAGGLGQRRRPPPAPPPPRRPPPPRAPPPPPGRGPPPHCREGRGRRTPWPPPPRRTPRRTPTRSCRRRCPPRLRPRPLWPLREPATTPTTS